MLIEHLDAQPGEEGRARFLSEEKNRLAELETEIGGTAEEVGCDFEVAQYPHHPVGEFLDSGFQERRAPLTRWLDYREMNQGYGAKMIWLGLIEACRLYAELGEDVFVQFLREELSAESGGNYARWWRKYPTVRRRGMSLPLLAGT